MPTPTPNNRLSDPDEPSPAGSGIFGLPSSSENASIILIPIPFDATASQATGSAQGPAAILDASRFIDLYDHRLGPIHTAGIQMLNQESWINELSTQTRTLTEPIIQKGGPDASDPPAINTIDAAGKKIRDWSYTIACSVLQNKQTPAVIGGEHAVSLGNIAACAQHHPGLGILQLDAHMDLRLAYEGFSFSHASIMRNVMDSLPDVASLTQVAIRDYSAGERSFCQTNSNRITSFFADDIFDHLAQGAPFASICDHVIQTLPTHIYISFDIDALDPANCPNTGTPVPGGLTYEQAIYLLYRIAEAGKIIVGFDLVEVAPPHPSPPHPATPIYTNTPVTPPWDAFVGSMVLYRLCGCAAKSQGLL